MDHRDNDNRSSSFPAPEERVLGLELVACGEPHYLAFQAGDQRVFVVGSSAHADVRLTSDGVAAVEFHIERRGETLTLMPADRARLVLVNACPVNGSAELTDMGVIEFSGQRMTTRIFAATVLENARARRSSGGGESYLSALPSEEDPTCLGITGRRALSDDELPTLAFRPCVEAPQSHPPMANLLVTQRIARPPMPGPVPPPALGPTGTTVIRRRDLAPPPAPTPSLPAAPSQGPPVAAVPPKVVALAPIIIRPQVRAPAPEVRPGLGPAPGREGVARVAASLANQTTTFDAAELPGLRPSVGHRQRSAAGSRAHGLMTKRPLVWVARLGDAARLAPLKVSLYGLLGAGAVAMTLAVVSKQFHDPKAPERRTAAGTQAKVASPHPSASLRVAPAANAAPPSVRVLALAVPRPVASSSVAARKGAPLDPETTDAAQHLTAGRDAKARASYAGLARRSPENPAYESLAVLLERLASSDCSASQQGKNVSCPEVKR